MIAEQAGEFDLDDVARDITDEDAPPQPARLRASGDPAEAGGRRVGHRGLGGDQGRPRRVATPSTDGLPPGLPALLYADKVLDRLDRAGAPRASRPAADDLGDRLLALVAEARQAGVDPEQALRDAVRRLL